MRTQVVGPPDDDFHHFPRCVFLVFVSVVHLRFMLQFFFHIRFAHTRLGFFPTRPDIKLCYAGCFAKRAQSGVARQVLLRRVRQPYLILKSNPGGDFSPPLPSPGPRLRRRPTPVLVTPAQAGSLWDRLGKISGPNLAPRRLQDRRQEGFFRILDPSWAIFVDLGPIMAPTSCNIVRRRRQDAQDCPN